MKKSVKRILVVILAVIIASGAAFGIYALSLNLKAEKLKSGRFELEQPLSEYLIQETQAVIDFAYDIYDKEKHMENSEYVFVAKFNRILGTVYSDVSVHLDRGKIYSTPFTVYEAKVKYVLKGEVKGGETREIYYRGGVTADGKWLDTEFGGPLPEEGSTYLCFAFTGTGEGFEGEICTTGTSLNTVIGDFDPANVPEIVGEYEHVLSGRNEKMKKVTKIDGYIKLTVTYPEEINSGKHFTLTAKVKNIGGETVEYTLPTGTPDMHEEIKIKFPSKPYAYFTDLDTMNRMFTCDIVEKRLEPGEVFTEKINFAPGSMFSPYNGGGKDGNDYYYDPGEYPATALFEYISPESGEYVDVSVNLLFRIV